MPSKKPAPSRPRSRFGRNVALLRLAKGLTQERFAEEVGLTVRHLQSIEAGEYFPSLATLLELQWALGCSWNTLFEGCEREGRKR